jgi:ABC-type nitrate/sulfonate/bicarbonate transport system substrate-binding protein
VTVGLDWTPNTNHTGLYVAHSKGYYADEGLNVEFLQAQEGGTIEQLVATGRLDFGISYQENVTLARVEGVPIVSIAAIIQHNTSGFASRREQGIISPKDFEGKTYGTWGSEMERVVIKELMACDGGDFSHVEFVDIGSSDFFVATEQGDVDFAWVFQGWTGIEAEKRGIDINMVLINDQHCVPDYYTPVIITSEEKIANNPDVVKSFMRAVSQGYDFAIASPDEAAEMLLAVAPELDKDLVRMSQRYLARNYQSDAPRWGEQQAEVWQEFADWMTKTGQMKEKIVAENAFTNEFLP